MGAYSIWPILELRALGRAIDSGADAELAERIDVASVQRAFVKQVVASYAKLIGITPHSLLQQVALSAAEHMAEPLLADLANVDVVAEMLRTGQLFGTVRAITKTQRRLDLDAGIWRLYWASEYAIDDHRISLPVGAQASEQFRLTLRRVGMRWVLSGILLPEPMRETLARELERSIKNVGQ